MSTNCLVSKLKGSFQNDNLPTFGVAKFGVANAGQVQIGSVSGDIHVTTRIPVQLYGTSKTVTEFTVPSGQNRYVDILTVDYNAATEEDRANFLEMDNIYNCSLCYFGHGGGNNVATCSGSILTPMRNKDNREAIYKYAPLEITSVALEDLGVDIADSVYYLLFNSGEFLDTANRADISKYLRMPNMEVISGNVMNSPGIPATIKNTNENYNDSNVIILGACFPGPITNLPLGIKYVDATGMTGSIDDFITLAKNNGRTEGVLTIGSSNYCTATFGGTALKTLLNNGDISPIAGTTITTCLVWNSEYPNGHFVNTVPEDGYAFVPNPSVYYLSKHQS